MRPILMAAALLMSAPLLAAEPHPGAADGSYPAKNTPEAAIYRGEIVFQHYCILCHGIMADGNGRAAKLYNPRPANLVHSDKNTQYKELIIKQGGKPLGRSEFMPPWGNELTAEQLSDLLSFLESIRSPKEKP